MSGALRRSSSSLVHSLWIMHMHEARVPHKRAAKTHSGTNLPAYLQVAERGGRTSDPLTARLFGPLVSGARSHQKHRNRRR